MWSSLQRGHCLHLKERVEVKHVAAPKERQQYENWNIISKSTPFLTRNVWVSQGQFIRDSIGILLPDELGLALEAPSHLSSTHRRYSSPPSISSSYNSATLSQRPNNSFITRSYRINFEIVIIAIAVAKSTPSPLATRRCDLRLTLIFLDAISHHNKRASCKQLLPPHCFAQA